MATWSEILNELGQTRAVLPKGVSPFDHVRRKYLSQLATHTGRSVILYASQWTQGGGDPDLVTITPEDVQGFMEVIHGLPTTGGLDLVLHLPGGSAESAEALVAYLRAKFDDIRVIVPHAAMSAATMLACSSNRILMGKHSSLGPIDPQFIIRTEQGRASVAAHAIIEQFRLAQRECRDPSLIPSWLPILKQYGPALLVQCQLATQLSQSLVAEWLARYMFDGDPDRTTKAEAVALALSDHAKFKSHGRFIDREQAKKLGLVIDDLESDQATQDGALSVFHATTHTFSATPAVKIIENHLGKAFIKQQLQNQRQQVVLVPQPTPAPQPNPGSPPHP